MDSSPQFPLVLPPNVVVKSPRETIIAFQVALQELVAGDPLHQLELEPSHHFAPGAYARELFIPADTCIVGKIHKHAHVNVVSQGDISVLTEEGVRRIQAPLTFISLPGTKRVVYAHTDTVWTTVHVTEETDLDKIEEYVIAKTYDDYDKLKAALLLEEAK